MPDRVDLFCAAIRESFPGAEIVYTRGGCWEFHKIMRASFPDARPYYRDGHVWSRIGDDYYDIFGRRAAGAADLTEMGEAALRGAHRWRDRRLRGLDIILAVWAGIGVEAHYDARL